MLKTTSVICNLRSTITGRIATVWMDMRMRAPQVGAVSMLVAEPLMVFPVRFRVKAPTAGKVGKFAKAREESVADGREEKKSRLFDLWGYLRLASRRKCREGVKLCADAPCPGFPILV